MFELVRQNFSRNLRIIVDKASIDRPEVGSILVPGQVQSDLEDKFVDLRVDLYAEEGHINFIYI